MAHWRDHYPFASNWFELDDVRMHYVDEGPRDAPVLVMCHGNPTWSFYYRELVKAFRDQYRIIVPDHIGCGLSDKPQDYTYTLEQHIQNLEALLAHLDVHDVTMVLHDWGGGIGMGYATRHPDNIKRFVVFNTSAFYRPTVPLILKMARSALLGEILVRGFNAFAGLAVYLGMGKLNAMPADIRKGYVTPYNSWRNRIAVFRFVQDIPLNPQHPTRATVNGIDDKLAAFQSHPMILMWGARDFVFTVESFLAGWQERFPNASVHIFEQAGHYVVEDATERIIPLMRDFLNNTTN